ncbi:MAG: hypothetical protein WB792_05425 [Desulfobacterales bacterium]
MEEKLIKTLDLKNGLQLKIYDASRNIVGDRWLVSLIARMEIPVTKVLEKSDSLRKENVNEIRDRLGESVIFEQKREKIFVDISEMESVFNGMRDIFLGSSLDYLSRETFPKRYILKKYKEQIKKASWFRADKSAG